MSFLAVAEAREDGLPGKRASMTWEIMVEYSPSPI